MALDDLLEGGPHRRYLYGYLSELQAQEPSWVVRYGNTTDGGGAIYIRCGGPRARQAVIPVLVGRELLAIRALRKMARQIE